VATETLSPDVLAVQTNLSGSVTDIQDDPDSPDGNWLTASSTNTDCVCRVTFPTPSGNLTTGADLQEFRVLYRNNPTNRTADQLDIYLYENGSQVGSVLLSQSDPSDSTVYSATWNAADLSNIDGSQVECYVYITADVAPTPQIASGDIGAIEWNVDYSTGVTTYTKTTSIDVSVQSAGETKTSSFNGAVQEAGLTKTTDFGAALQKALTKDTSLSGALKALSIEKTTSSSAVLKALGLERNISLSGRIEENRVGFASTAPFGAAGRAYSFTGKSGVSTYTKSTTLGTILQQQALLKTATISAALQKELTKDVDFNTLVQSLESLDADMNALLQIVNTLNSSLNSILQKSETKDTSLSGILKLLDNLLTSSISAALLQEDITLTSNLSGALKKTGVTDTLSINALLLKNIEVTTVLSGVLEALDITKTTSLNAYLSGASELTTNLDAALAKLGLTKETNLSAALQEAGLTKTFDLSGALQEAGITDTTSLNAYLQKLIEATTSINAIVKKVGEIKTTSLGALIQGDGIFTGLNAALKKLDLTETTSLSAIVEGTITKLTYLDLCILKGGLSRPVSFDAPVMLQRIANMSFNSLLRKEETKSISLDSALAEVGLALNVDFTSIIAKTVRKTINLTSYLVEYGVKEMSPTPMMISGRKYNFSSKIYIPPSSYASTTPFGAAGRKYDFSLKQLFGQKVLSMTALLQKAHQVVTSFSAYVYDGTVEITNDVDAYIAGRHSSSWFNQKWYTTDWFNDNWYVLIQSVVVGLNALLTRQEGLRTTYLSGHVIKFGELYASMSAAIYRLRNLQTDMSAAILEEGSLATELNAILRKVITVSSSLNAEVIRLPGLGLIADMNALLLKPMTIMASLDSTIMRNYNLTLSMEALVGVNGLATSSLNSLLKKLDVPVTTRVGAVIYDPTYGAWLPEWPGAQNWNEESSGDSTWTPESGKDHNWTEES